MKKIVFATNNKHKLQEVKAILAGKADVLGLADIGCNDDIPETGNTLEENALLKARYVYEKFNTGCFADDTGLEIEALDGRPGVYSARYAGEHGDDAQNCAKVLHEMENQENRAAHFTCVLSLAVPSGPALTWEGRCEGEILREKRGNSGFGYDPLFFYPNFGKTFAEVPLSQKNTISHRGKALQEFAAEFPKVEVWLRQRMDELKPPKPDHSEFEHNDWSQERMVK